MAPRPEATTTLFQPTPIPEAKAFRWDDLLPPSQRALREFLTWLKAACDTSAQPHEKEHLSTSLLISGVRGSGKTTVLLSAAQALENWRDFMGAKERAPHEPRKPQEAELEEILQELHHRIIWMEPLDVEPLPKKTNLLATVLVRVRAAVDNPLPGQKQSRVGRSSILEESAEETLGQLDQLIHDATFMWEEIQATDARTLADLQIKASDIASDFQRRFIDTMEKVSQTLSLPRFGHEGGRQVLLVLPIDNVDRSIEHLYNIVKLNRMVSSRRLWFVLAAGHQEFQLFMERAFQNELIASGQAGIGAKGRDETLAIARRQAATTLRRALPPSYRIRIEPVSAEEAWYFPYHGGKKKEGKSDREQCLHELLDKLELPTNSSRTTHLKVFSKLFDLTDLLTSDVQKAYRSALKPADEAPTQDGELEEREDRKSSPEQTDGHERRPIFTYAAQVALNLPARTLQDLWHAAYRECKRQEFPEESGERDVKEKGEGAVNVAAAMLRNAIDESSLPAWASQQLHNRIIRRNHQHKIILDLTGQPVRRAKRTTLSDVLEWPRWEEYDGDGHPAPWKDDTSNRSVLISELHLRRFGDTILMLHELGRPENCVPIPPDVAGWFMLLHDLLMLFDEPRVLNQHLAPHEMSPDFVVTLHELWVERAHIEPFVKLEFPWSLPTWDTFFDFALFTTQWRAAVHESKKLFTYTDRADINFVKTRFRFVQAAWVDSICAIAGPERGGWDWRESYFKKVIDDELRNESLEEYERRVRKAVSHLYHHVQTQGQGYDRLWIGGVWLEQTLPLLTLPEFAPSPLLSRLLCWEGGERKDKEAWDALVEHWERHLPRLTRLREMMVRDTAVRSSAYEKLSSSSGTAQAPMEWGRKWLNEVLWDWFTSVDADHDKRKLDVLRYLTPRWFQKGMKTGDQEAASEEEYPP